MQRNSVPGLWENYLEIEFLNSNLIYLGHLHLLEI
jgi:hypothetical protein